MSGPNWQNRTLFHGDNLAFLRAMNSESVDLIATDPPFNKGRDFHATPDSLAAGARFQDRWSWERDVHEEWTDRITDDYPRLMEAIESARYAHSDGMGAYMCFMAVRLLEMHRLLKPTGSIYLHCDPTASHYLKAVMDAIFGQENFRSEIIWKRTGSHGGASRWGPIHDTILFAAKSRAQRWNRTFQPYSEEYLASHYSHQDARGRYQPVSLTGTGTRTGESGLPWRGVDPTAVGRHWAVPGAALQAAFPDRTDLDELTTQQRLDLLDEAGLIHWPPRGKVPRQKRYADENPGVPLQDMVTDIAPAGGAERNGYPTQKPLALYERMIRASSNEGDIVLDPFAGCATTLVAAERLRRQWVGMDIWEGAHRLVEDRLADTTGLFGSVTFTADPPERTDDGGEAAPFLRVKVRVKEPEGPRWTRAEMYAHLLDQHGPRCMGCDRTFDDPRYLELDHNTPRSDGGLNHISNRVLLCSPCNRLKSNTYTLSGLRRENRKRGYMAN